MEHGFGKKELNESWRGSIYKRWYDWGYSYSAVRSPFGRGNPQPLFFCDDIFFFNIVIFIVN
jgi:hypothetical protein